MPSKEELLHQRISQYAYAMWEESGKPEGQDLDFWLRAESWVNAGFIDDSPQHQKMMGDFRKRLESLTQVFKPLPKKRSKRVEL